MLQRPPNFGKFPNRHDLPKTTATNPNKDNLRNLCLGTLDPAGLVEQAPLGSNAAC